MRYDRLCNLLKFAEILQRVIREFSRHIRNCIVTRGRLFEKQIDRYNEILKSQLSVNFLFHLPTMDNKKGGRDNSALPIRRWTTRHRAVSAPDISVPFPFFFFFELWTKKKWSSQFLECRWAIACSQCVHDTRYDCSFYSVISQIIHVSNRGDYRGTAEYIWIVLWNYSVDYSDEIVCKNYCVYYCVLHNKTHNTFY